MNLMRWDPFLELEDVSSRLNRLFGRLPAARQTDEDGGMFAEWTPAVDVHETDKEYLVKADLPEVKRDDVRVGIDAGILSVEGERKLDKEEKGKTVHRIERAYGRFMRRMTLPPDVDATNVAAEFKDGVLTVHLPKSNVPKPRMIDVKVA